MASLLSQERIVAAITALYVPFIAYLAYLSYLKAAVRLHTYPNLNHAHPKDLVWALFFCVVFIPVRYVSQMVLIPYGYRLVSRFAAEADHRKKGRRVAMCWTFFLYYTFASVVGWYVLHDKEWSPWWIPGSHGHIDNCWVSIDLPSDVKMYYLMSLGWALMMLSYQWFETHRRDFLEMILHHYSTIFLVTFSYLLGYTRIGTLILFAHDACDVIGNVARSFSDTKKDVILGVLFVFMLGVWGFLRMYIYPFEILESVLWGGTRVTMMEPIPYHNFFICILFVLACLNVFWYSMFLRILYNVLATRKNCGDMVDADRKKES